MTPGPRYRPAASDRPGRRPAACGRRPISRSASLQQRGRLCLAGRDVRAEARTEYAAAPRGAMTRMAMRALPEPKLAMAAGAYTVRGGFPACRARCGSHDDAGAKRIGRARPQLKQGSGGNAARHECPAHHSIAGHPGRPADLIGDPGDGTAADRRLAQCRSGDAPRGRAGVPAQHERQQSGGEKHHQDHPGGDDPTSAGPGPRAGRRRRPVRRISPGALVLPPGWWDVSFGSGRRFASGLRWRFLSAVWASPSGALVLPPGW